MKFLFTCGGTAGHINPAIGVAGALRKIIPDCEILFVGAKGMMETELVPREGYAIETVTITNLQRSLSPKGIVHNLKTVKNVITSIEEAKAIIRRFQPDVAVGTGGYVCYPVLKAAHALGIPTLVHESNAVPGLTTKMLSGVVDCVMVGFEEAAGNYQKGNVVVTGTPVRTDFYGADKVKARQTLGLDPAKPLVLSVWGSLGSAYMNKTMTDVIALAEREGAYHLIHSAGKRGYASMTQALQERCSDYAEHGMDVREYIYDMPTVMTAADLILCRSGASTLAELTALGRPAIFVPSPNVTNNHQEKNARLMERGGAAKVLLEGEFTAEGLHKSVKTLLADPTVLEQMSVAMRTMGTEEATEKIVELVLSYVK